MLLYAFPIAEPLRFYALFFEWILAFICFELGVVFVVKYRRQQVSKKYKQELGYASLFLGFSFLWFCFIAADYYMDAVPTMPYLIWPRGSPRDLMLSIAFFGLITGAFLFIFFTERHQAVIFRRFLFTFIYGGLMVVYIVVFFQDIESTDIANFLLLAVFAVFFVAFLVDLSKRMKTRRDVATTLSRFLVAFAVLGCGYILTVDSMLDVTGLAGRTVGAIMQLAAFVSITIQFLRLPPFAMLDWHKQIEEIYVIDKSGVCLFQKMFTGTEKAVDYNLVSSALASVNYILHEMTSTADQGQSTIKKGDKTITMFSSELVNGVVISKEENYLINYNLKNFIETFEAIYRGVLATWKGDNKVFEPAEAMAEKIFSS
jgi:hypothetical protein